MPPSRPSAAPISHWTTVRSDADWCPTFMIRGWRARGGGAVVRLSPGFSPWQAGLSKPIGKTAVSLIFELVQKTAVDLNTR